MQFLGSRQGEYKLEHVQHMGLLHAELCERVLDVVQDCQRVLVRVVRPRMMRETAVSCAYVIDKQNE